MKDKFILTILMSITIVGAFIWMGFGASMDAKEFNKISKDEIYDIYRNAYINGYSDAKKGIKLKEGWKVDSAHFFKNVNKTK
jgi:hypothetical protein